MDECKGQPAATAPPAAAAAPQRGKDSRVKDADQTAAASSSSDAAAVFMSRLLPARVEAAECDICNEALESSEAAGGAAAASRLPRMLPCGHSCCTSCIQKGLDANHGLLKCPQCGGFDPPQRIDSALKLPKNFTAIKMIEAQADRDAMAELAALPCQQCDPTQPRQPAKVHCDDCGSDFCSQHDQQAHTAPQLASHMRVSISEHAAQLSAAATAKRNAAFAAAAAINRMAAQAEEKKIKEALEDAKGQLAAPTQDLDAIKSDVEDTAKELHAVADQLHSDFEKHRQMITRANQQLANSGATFAPLLHIAQQVQRADNFDANLHFAQLQRDSPQVHAQVQQVLHQSRRSFDVDSVHELREWLSLSNVKRQSLILNTEMAAQLAPFIKGLECKGHPDLLYRASRDGFNKDDFIRSCANKGPTMTVKVSTTDASQRKALERSIHCLLTRRLGCAAGCVACCVQVKDSGFVFGAYTHCAWPRINGTVADPTGQSFIFSLVNATGKAVRFSLRDNDCTIDVAAGSVRFGVIKKAGGRQTAWPNFALMRGGLASDQKGANVANPVEATSTYQSDDGHLYDATFLAGQQRFAVAEIEVFQM